MKQIQLSENSGVQITEIGSWHFFVLDEDNEPETEQIIQAREAAALTRYLVTNTLKELEGELSNEITKENTLFTNSWNDGRIEGIRIVLSLIRAKLKGGEDGKVQD